jgi:DNA modification methylase
MYKYMPRKQVPDSRSLMLMPGTSAMIGLKKASRTLKFKEGGQVRPKAESPLRLPLELILIHVPKGGYCFDLFAGTLTTAIAAHLIDRIVVCMESDKVIMSVISFF